jgi:hypothetical protein
MARRASEPERTTWRGLPAWRLAGDRLWAVFCPERGAKITSLFDARTGREWLVPAPLRPLRALTYGSTWSAYEMCGWDEVFPTLQDCAYPGPGRNEGRRLPDHGEVWCMSWADDGPGGATVVGAALPYRLTRSASVADDRLVLDYALTNDGDDAMPFLWAAHPLISLTAGCDVVVGPGSAAVLDQGRSWLRLAWDQADVPFFSVADADALLNPSSNVAPMPSTGGLPSLAAAAQSGRVRVAPAGTTVRWRLTATVGDAPLPP